MVRPSCCAFYSSSDSSRVHYIQPLKDVSVSDTNVVDIRGPSLAIEASVVQNQERFVLINVFSDHARFTVGFLRAEVDDCWPYFVQLPGICCSSG